MPTPDPQVYYRSLWQKGSAWHLWSSWRYELSSAVDRLGSLLGWALPLPLDPWSGCLELPQGSLILVEWLGRPDLQALRSIVPRSRPTQSSPQCSHSESQCLSVCFSASQCFSVCLSVCVSVPQCLSVSHTVSQCRIVSHSVS